MNIRRGLALAVVGATVVVVSTLTGNHLPLYDGLAAPDEPYRYVNPPEPQLRTSNKPGSAKVTFELTSTQNDYTSANSGETGPQVNFNTYISVLRIPSGATQATLQMSPLAPGKNKPSVGQIAGNIYHFTAMSTAGTVGFIGSSSNPSYINLRLPQWYNPDKTVATIQYRQTGTWKRLPTSQVGNDIYQAPLVGLGDYVLTAQKSPSKSQGKPPLTVFLGVGCLVIAFAGIVLFIRQQSTEDTHEPKKHRK